MVNLAVRGYLVVYNLASFFGWALILSTLIKHLYNGPQTSSVPIQLSEKFLSVLRPLRTTFIPSHADKVTPDFLAKYLDRAATLHTYTGALVALVQSGAVLEIVHASIGFVKSPVPTTAIQVASRLWLVWGISERYSEAATSPFYASMIFAWSLTECVRYPFYANALMGSENGGLNWARYTLFYVLYPLGAGSEAMLMFRTLPSVLPWNDPSAWHVRDYFVSLLFVLWWPGLYVMYTHMMKQRRRAIGKGFWGNKVTADRKKTALAAAEREKGIRSVADASWATGESSSSTTSKKSK